MLVRIYQTPVASHRVESDEPYHQFVKTLVHLLFKIHIVVIGHRHVSHNRVIGAAVVVQGIEQVKHHYQKGHGYHN